jgi:PhnB protein
MANKAKPVPEGFHTVTPYLVLNDGARAIEFYKKAFGAKEIMRMPGPDGSISHAEVKIGDSIIMLGSSPTAHQPQGESPVNIFLYLEDVDTTFKNALAAGAKQLQPLADQPWGDRYGRVTDPFGHVWALATHVEDVSPDEMARRMQEAMKAHQARSAAS